MDKFGFVFHPLDIGLYADGFSEPGIKKKRPELVEKVMTWLTAFKRSTVTGIRSTTGKKVEGDMILVSLLPEQILNLNSKFVLDKIVQAGKIAEDLGDKILGLGAYASQVGHKGGLVGRKVGIPVTTGNCYTVAVSIDATVEACNSVGIALENARICIIGASGNIGGICAHIFSMLGPKELVLCARHLPRLKKAADSVKASSGKTEVTTHLDISQAVKDSDVIITATSTPAALLDITALKPGAVVCDVSRPRNVSVESKRKREDVLVIDGGIVLPPGDPDFHFSFGLPHGLAYACMAETMILACEEKYESYSLGGNLTLEKVREIKRLAVKHGFKLAKLRSFDKEITAGQIDKVRAGRNVTNNQIQY